MSKTKAITPNQPADFTPNLGDYKTLQPFRYWCQKVLPLVYDDSLSYYELLCKVVDYLNKTMEDVEVLHGDVTNLHEAYDKLQEYVNDYFSTLDVQEEINNKLNQMASDGTLSALLRPMVINNLPPIVVDSTGKMTDKSKMYILSTTGHLYQWDEQLNAFSDTGLSYGTIGNVLSTKISISEGNLNDVAVNTIIALSYPTTGAGFVNSPINHPGYLITYQFGDNENARMQVIWDYNDTSVWWRQSDVNGNWSEWINTTSIKDGGVVGSSNLNYPYATLRNMNNAPVNTLISLNSPLPDEEVYLNTPDDRQGAGYVITYQWGDNANARLQFYYDYSAGNAWRRTCKTDGTWSRWLNVTSLTDGGVVGTSLGNYPNASIVDMNDAPINNLISLNSPVPEELGGKYYNTPEGRQDPGYVITYQWGDDANARLQFYYSYDSGLGFYRVSNINGEWTDWKVNNNSITYNTTKNVTENTYNNTYNITTSPEIKTDTNGWLASTNDETDRTGDIMAILNETGYCHLGEGAFYISGQIEMPSNSTIIGCGNNTVLRALSSYEGAMVITTDYCVVSNLKMQANGTPSENIGAEVGILIYDTKTDFSGSGAVSTHNYRNNRIEGVFFTNFNGSGVELRGTGGSTNEGSIISNCRFENCSVGINLAFFTEYHKIDACIIGNTNYIGVINNGGNNNFVNCTLSGSNSAFVIDNSDGSLINEAHGLCVGCCFNHTDGNAGDAIRILGTNNGFLFSGCEYWYGVIRIDKSKGITFNGIHGGGSTDKIIVSNSVGIMFHGMQLNVTPEITNDNNTNLRFINCFNYLTGDVIGA